MVWGKDGRSVQGLDVSRWSEKRVQVDFSNRLVFYSLEKQDEGHYRCIVDLEVAALYHVQGKSHYRCIIIIIIIIIIDIFKVK